MGRGGKKRNKNKAEEAKEGSEKVQASTQESTQPTEAILTETTEKPLEEEEEKKVEPVSDSKPDAIEQQPTTDQITEGPSAQSKNKKKKEQKRKKANKREVFNRMMDRNKSEIKCPKDLEECDLIVDLNDIQL